MDIVAWLMLGCVVGYLAALYAGEDEGLGVLASLVFGVLGAVLGGGLAALLPVDADPQAGPLHLGELVLATAGSALTVLLVDRFIVRDRVRV